MKTVKSLIAASAVVSTAALAAPPATNTGGSADTKANTQKLVALSNLTGVGTGGIFEFEAWDGVTANVTASGSACVWTNYGAYDVTATGLHTTGTQLRMQGGTDTAQFLNYAVNFDGTDLAAGTASTISRAIGQRDCAGINNVTVTLTVIDSDLELTPYDAAGYTDTLTVTLSTQ